MGDRERKTVLVTGASTGLGLALARRLLATDYRVVLTARRGSLARFGETGIADDGDRVLLRPLDVTSAPERHALIEELDDRFAGVDVLVNNAGLMYRAVLEHVSDEERVAQMDVNYLAPMDLIRLVLPRMRARRAGRIINVSSVGGMMAMPTMAAYSASKFALEGATEALFYEVRPWNIRVSMVQPGFIHSEAYTNVRFTPESRLANDDVHLAYHAHYEHMSPFIERLMTASRATPDRVAKKILKTMRRRHPPLRVPATLDAHVFTWFRRILPRSLYHWMLYRMLPDIRAWGHDEDAVPELKEGPAAARSDRSAPS